MRSCRHVALPFYTGPTIWGPLWVISEKISCRLISNEKKVKNLPGGKSSCTEKKCLYTKKRLYVGEKNSISRFEKRNSYPNQITQPPSPHPLKSQLVGPKGSKLSVLVPRRRSHQKPRADLDHGQKIPYRPLTCRSKMFVLRRHISRQEGGSKCCRWRCGERSSSTRFIQFFASLKVGTRNNFFNKNM